ncbi:MAG: Abi family protein [Chloroflexi bacterium]|nr:Abi family protein [Chloroflexota bacterium]
MQDYTKTPLTYTEQVALLQSRGLTITDTIEAAKFFKQVNYYRFSAYCIPFQNPRDVFTPSATFEKIVELYRLDEELRNAFMALLSPIEIFLRTRIVYELSHIHGPFFFFESTHFRTDFKHAEWLASLKEEVMRGKETFIDHYKTKYNGFPYLPLWMACEIMSIGTLSFLYYGLLPDIQRRICSVLEIHHYTLANWMHVITYLRNICAHHGRLWNREMAIRPFIPNKDKRWTTITLDNKHLFAIVAVTEWICNKAEIQMCNVEPVYETMSKIAAIDTRFAGMMGVPADRAIGMCWEIKQ